MTPLTDAQGVVDVCAYKAALMAANHASGTRRTHRVVCIIETERFDPPINVKYAILRRRCSKSSATASVRDGRLLT
jgi:hypothetical protein